MSETMNGADVGRRLPELMSRAGYDNERFLITRRGIPMAALFSAVDLALLEQRQAPPQGLLAAAGACADFDDFDLMIENIYRNR